MSIRFQHCVFVHIPRTGGLWLHAIAQRLGLRHFPLKGDLDGHLPYTTLPRVWRNLPAFTFLRHPFDWLVSRWSHVAEHHLADDYRHYGIHRTFDRLWKPKLKDTVEEILRSSPGLVGLTYGVMSQSVNLLLRTEDLPQAAWVALQELEGLGEEHKEVVLSSPATNGTGKLTRYQEEANQLDPILKQQFLDSEQEAMTLWRSARHVERA